jgi:hypothetical protein
MFATLTASRPSYGYRRSAGHDPVNAKRVYLLMKKSGMLLARIQGVAAAAFGAALDRLKAAW